MNPPRYRILFKKSAEKELRAISVADLKRILKKIVSLESHPRPEGVILLKGEKRFYRLRQGDYRIIYEVRESIHEILVIKIGHRREVYKGY